MTILILIVFIMNSFMLYSHAQAPYVQDLGMVVAPSRAFKPVLLKGMTIHPENPLALNFVIDGGDAFLATHSNGFLEKESRKLINYFLAALTVPQGDLWVNLSPYEKDRIIPDGLNRTELGYALLSQDFLLKKLTASLLYPEGDTGKEFWRSVYQKTFEKYGTTEIPVDTFNKVWIVPHEATIYEKGQTVYVMGAKLDVMLESDYVARENNASRVRNVPVEQNDISKEIMRTVVIPVIEKEVNEGESFAPLRQVVYSLVLAKWYKQNFKDAVINKVYADKNLIAGIDLANPVNREVIHADYMKAYVKGVFNVVQEEQDLLSNQGSGSPGAIIPRKYFSGGFEDSAMSFDRVSEEKFQQSPKGREFDLAMNLRQVDQFDPQSFKVPEVREVWNYFHDEILAHDPNVMRKTKGKLTLIYHQINQSLHSIDEKISRGDVRLIKHINFSKDDMKHGSVEDYERPVNIGVLALSANPLNWAHINSALQVMDEQNLDAYVFLVQGGMSYKGLLPKDVVSEKDRHFLAQSVLKHLEPLIYYSDVGKGSDQIGEINVHQLFKLNPKQKMTVFYMAGTETKSRVVGIFNHIIDGIRTSGFGDNKDQRLGVHFVPIDDLNSSVFIQDDLDTIRREVEKDRGVTFQELGVTARLVIPGYYFSGSDAHSTEYRKGDRSLVPATINKEAELRGYYGYPPRVMKDGVWITISIEAAIRDRLKPLVKTVVDRLLKESPDGDVIVGIDGNSASGKSLVAKLIQQELLDRNKACSFLGMDVRLKDRLYRHAIQKMVVGERLSINEEASFSQLKVAGVESGKEYTNEGEFFDNKSIQGVLMKARRFFDGESQDGQLVIENPYDQETKSVGSEPLRVDLKRGSYLIFEGKYANHERFQPMIDTKIRIDDDNESVRVRFELRTRRLSPEDADRQLEFFNLALTPSYKQYDQRTRSQMDYVFDVTSEKYEEWHVKADPAMTRGGIDLNELLLVQKGGRYVEFNADEVMVQNMIKVGVQGFVPIIVNITPILLKK